MLKKIGVLWKEAQEDQETDKYVKMAEEDKKRYEEEMANYEPVVSDSSEPKVSKKKASTKVVKTGPKKARSAYIFFCSDARQEITANLGEEKPSKNAIMYELSKRWEETKSNPKLLQKYTKMAEEDKIRYTSEKSSVPEQETEPVVKVTKTKGRKPKVTKKVEPKVQEDEEPEPEPVVEEPEPVKPVTLKKAVDIYIEDKFDEMREKYPKRKEEVIRKNLRDAFEKLDSESEELQIYLAKELDILKSAAKSKKNEPKSDDKKKFVNFAKRHREEYNMKYPSDEYTHTVITQMMAKAWKELSEEEKAKYE